MAASAILNNIFGMKIKMKIILSEKQINQICQHGAKTYPEECCGFLVGSSDHRGAVVRHVLPAENEHQESRRNRYTISPQDYLKAEKWADARGLQLLGFYHSHPDHPAQPSQYDLEHAWPNLVYVITEIQQGEAGQLNGFLLAPSRENFSPVPIVINKES